MQLETDEDTACPQLSRHKEEAITVYQAQMPNGRQIKLLKTLLTSVCERDCAYCPFRAGRDFHRGTFKPEELAHTFQALQRAGTVEGLFLSSGVFGGGSKTQDALNLEAPNAERLSKLAPHKHFTEELLQALHWVEEIRRSQPAQRGWNGYWPSLVTQFVVGAVGDTDLELLSTTQDLYSQLHLQRAYFSAFHPVAGTPFENQPPAQAARQKRLYEASFLLRDYAFDVKELLFDSNGYLPLETDPKLAWAQINLKDQPVEINSADRQTLLRIPGIGPKSAAAICSARCICRLRELSQLRRLSVNVMRAAPYILLDGIHPAYQTNFPL